MGFDFFFVISIGTIRKKLGTWEEHQGNNVILFSFAFGQRSSLGYRQEKIEINIGFMNQEACKAQLAVGERHRIERLHHTTPGFDKNDFFLNTQASLGVEELAVMV